ncbi:VCBS repeat-containing protein [bacterium]|nr:VCBS repeat-containing protein [candidate division CSSED10-310 bacterium]
MIKLRPSFVCIITYAIMVLPPVGYCQSKSPSLSYTESSTGLGIPGLDSGRTEVELADVNHDGNVDIICLGDHGNPHVGSDQHGIMVWLGDGNNGWSVCQFGEFGYGGVAVADVNGDGWMDIGYGIHHNYSSNDLGDQLLEVALGDGSGCNWTPWDDGLASAGESWGMFCTDFADIDGDGDLDIVSNSFGAGSGIHAYMNNFDGTWTHAWGFLDGNSTMDIVFGDINNDGFPDFAAANENGTTYINDTQGGFIQSDGNLPSAGTMGRFGPDLGDVNGDGCQDLSFIASNGVPEVWLWSEGNVWIGASEGLPSDGDYSVTQLCCLDEDTAMDLAAFGQGLVTVWLGDGAGNWSETISFTVGSPGYFSAFRTGVDADHNGFPDIALVEKEGSWPNELNHLKFYRETRLPDVLFTNLTSPRGNERYLCGSVRFIEWCTGVPSQNACTVNLYLSILGPTGPWQAVAENIPDTGSYQWTVPLVPASNDCYLRIVVMDGSDNAEDMNDVPFAVIGREPTATPTPDCVYDGDVNADGCVTAGDAQLTFMIVLGLFSPSFEEACAADCNADGDVTSGDAQQVFLTALGQATCYE